MLEILGLEKSFDGRRILRGLDLAVSSRETVALLGGNGSGKTTTLRSIAGLVRPDAGRIEVDGVDAIFDGKNARRKLSFLPQKSIFPPTLSVQETLAVAARLRGAPDSRVERELEECELANLRTRAVSTISGGERQRLGLAVAFLADVDFYLFDEPTANLDAQALAIFLRRARRLAEEGSAVIFTTHVAADVESLATRVEVLQDGRLESQEAQRKPLLFPQSSWFAARAVLTGSSREKR